MMLSSQQRKVHTPSTHQCVSQVCTHSPYTSTLREKSSGLVTPTLPIAMHTHYTYSFTLEVPPLAAPLVFTQMKPSNTTYVSTRSGW